jgi:hypothetical protein
MNKNFYDPFEKKNTNNCYEKSGTGYFTRSMYDHDASIETYKT